MDNLPADTSALAAWFAEGVRSELTTLEKDGGAQIYEVHSGELVESIGLTQALFQFILADGTRIPEDATGRLKTASDEYGATVVGQEANRIHVQLEASAPLPPGIPRGTLLIDDAALLRRLLEVLEETAASPAVIGPLATTVFHPARATVGFVDLPDTPALRRITGDPRRVVERACGSSLTYVWGPPGTGKTYTIAYLVTALIEAGERVLIASHTHAAVDQALCEAVKSEGDQLGPLANHPIVNDGKVLRIGLTPNPKVPEGVRLDKVMERRAGDIQVAISELEAKARPLVENRARCRAGVSEWDKLAEFTKRLEVALNAVAQSEAKRAQTEDAINRGTRVLRQWREELVRAQRAWFRRKVKTERASQALQKAEGYLRKSEATLTLVRQEKEKASNFANEMETVLIKQRALCQRFLAREVLEEELSAIALELSPMEEEINALQEEISQLEQRLINDARAVFCTLTKNYIGKELEKQQFDAVIVDEISMALPPLLFLAAGRATSRVILAGDFLQLPPIVRSDTPISSERLAQDSFHLAGVAFDTKPVENCAVMARLETQRRMVPAIADVARHLAYGPNGIHDHVSVLDRTAPSWLDFLPPKPLVILDTADLHCWSGKQPGSLSRFNFYSATVAVELAAMAAANLRPAEDERPIGIITPFAAQRRLIVQLVTEMKLDRWVHAGTVHTFQGGQAQFVIFDSVLDDPYWSARLCNPRDYDKVKRELNVAVTRAKDKFVLIGSSEWLNKHAKPESALGSLWAFFQGPGGPCFGGRASGTRLFAACIRSCPRFIRMAIAISC